MTFEAPVDLARRRRRARRLRRDRRASACKSLRVVMLWQNVAPAPDVARASPTSTRPTRRSTTGAPTTRRSSARPARGWQVLLTVSGPVPRWATNGASDIRHAPEPEEFQAFMTAVGAPLRREGRALVDLERAQPAAVPAAAVLNGAHARVAAASTAPLPRRRARPRRRRPWRRPQVLIGETSPRGTRQGRRAADVPARDALPGRELPQARARCGRLHADRLRPPRLHDAPRARCSCPSGPTT